MSRQRLAELSKKLNVREKAPRNPRAKAAESAKKTNEPSFRSFSKLAPKSSELLQDDDDNISELSYLHQSSEQPEEPTFIDLEPSSSSSLTEDSIRHFDPVPEESKPSKGSKKQVIEDREEIDDDLDSNMSFDERLPAPVKGASSRPVSVRPAPREIIDSRASASNEPVPKQSLVRLIRSSQLNSAGSELVDAVRELIVEFTKTVLTESADPQGQISSTNLRRYIGFFIRNEETEMNQDVVISPVHFQRLIQPICTEHKLSIKRDGFYLLHLFVETVIVKILQGSDMVADASKRQRVCAKDLLVAYSIYMM